MWAGSVGGVIGPGQTSFPGDQAVPEYCRPEYLAHCTFVKFEVALVVMEEDRPEVEAP